MNPLRTTHGTSTRPATGSQASPSVFCSVSAAACTVIAGVPPSRYVSAPAAIAAPTPCSAWQPPAAPESSALAATRAPKPPATTSPRAVATSEKPRSSEIARSVPGTMPAAPAVGAATMIPMREFSSSTAIE